MQHEDPGQDLKSAAQDLVGLVCEGVLGCDGASLSLLQSDTATTLAASQDFVLALDVAQYARGSGPCLTAMRAGSGITVDDFADEQRWRSLADDARAAGVRSSLSVPLWRDDQVVGGLNLYGKQVAAFSDASRDAADAFARQAVLMLGYLGRLQVEQAAHEQERRVSAALQHSLLPVLPQLPGITTAARYLVGSDQAQVGGDWYDVFALPDGAIGVAVGDVMGHDIVAAAAMGQLRSVLRSYAYEGSSPSIVLDRLDRLVQDFGMAQLATAVYGRLVLDVDGGMLLFSNAGHLPPVVRGPDGSVQVLRREAAPLIGVTAPGEAQRGERAVALPAGALVLLFTDGLVETRQRSVDDGLDLLRNVLADLPDGTSPEQACDLVLGQLLQDGQEDDVALLVLQMDVATDRA